MKCIALSAALALAASGASAATLTTLFASNNGQQGNMFDVIVGASDITVLEFAINLDAGTTSNVSLWYREGTIVGNANDSSGWTQIETASLTSAGTDAPTAWDVSDFTLSGGTTYGFLVYSDQINVNYTNGTAVGNIAAADGFLSIAEGYGRGNSADPFASSVFQPRIWNGSIVYEVAAVPLPATGVMLLMAFGGLAAARRRKG